MRQRGGREEEGRGRREGGGGKREERRGKREGGGKRGREKVGGRETSLEEEGGEGGSWQKQCVPHFKCTP